MRHADRLLLPDETERRPLPLWAWLLSLAAATAISYLVLG